MNDASIRKQHDDKKWERTDFGTKYQTIQMTDVGVAGFGARVVQQGGSVPEVRKGSYYKSTTATRRATTLVEQNQVAGGIVHL